MSGGLRAALPGVYSLAPLEQISNGALMASESDRTPRAKYYSPPSLAAAYKLTCDPMGVNREAQTSELVVAFIREHGGPEALAMLEKGLQELAEIQARKSPGRPRGSSKAARELQDGSQDYQIHDQDPES